MKLIGKVNGINRRAAEHTRGDQIAREKRCFMVQLRPAMPAGSYFGYGSMDFYLNGAELDDFTVDLGDTLDVYLLKAGESSEFQAEDLRRQLREAQAELETSRGLTKRFKESNERLTEQQAALHERLRAAANVNGNLIAQIEALNIGRREFQPGHTLIESSASGTEAGTGETEGLDPKGDGPPLEERDAQ